MKKIATLLLCLLFLIGIIGMTACEFSLSSTTSTPQTSTEDSGTETNATIMAVYEQATALGYEGSLEDFLALVKGKDGEQGEPGKDGANGKDGVGIVTILKTGTEGNVDTYSIVLTNGETVTFTITNGSNGNDGQNGQDAYHRRWCQ